MTDGPPDQQKGLDAMPNTDRQTPVRGPLSMTVTSATPQIVAGSDFSIFVVVQNPYDVPVTLYQIQTHIPVELIDVNAALFREQGNDGSDDNLDAERRNPRGILAALTRRRRHRQASQRIGIATAVGTNYAPEEAKELFQVRQQIQHAAEGATAIGIQFSFPENPTVDELDQIMRRFLDYKSGVIPIKLQPGDTVVRQFRLRTRHALLFTPLTHTFQIQAQFATDGSEHSCSIPYQATIRAPLSSMSIGALFGSAAGAVTKSLTDVGQFMWGSLVQGVLVAALVGVAVVVGFARKSSAQSFVSVEDFWGGALIGFTVGFLGYTQFLSLLRAAQ